MADAGILHEPSRDDDWITAIRNNWSISRLSASLNDDDDAHFRRCWARQNCRSCLHQPSCSWCPFSSVCVPNDCAVPALAPAFDKMVCPYWAERWELRTRPLGCQVSTITSLTALVTGSGMLVVAALIWLLIWGVHRYRTRQRIVWRWVQWPPERASTPTIPSSQPGEQTPLIAP